MSSAGQDLLDVANEAWNSRRAEYGGVQFRLAVNQAIRQDVSDKSKKRKLKREEAVATVSHIFDTARQSEATRLSKVAEDAIAKKTSTGTDLNSFATDVANSIQTTEIHDGTFGIIDPMSLITLITTIISTLVPLFQACKKPTPTPTPSPTPAPST